MKNIPKTGFVHGIKDPVFTKYTFKHASVNSIVEYIRTFLHTTKYYQNTEVIYSFKSGKRRST